MRRAIVEKQNSAYSMNFTLDSESIDGQLSFMITNMLTGKAILKGDSTTVAAKYDLYIASDYDNYPIIIFVNEGTVTFLDLANKEYDEVIQYVLKYFQDNPNIDKRLLPIWLQRISDEWLVEKSLNYNDWQGWLNTKDDSSPPSPSDSLIWSYRKYLHDFSPGSNIPWFYKYWGLEIYVRY